MVSFCTLLYMILLLAKDRRSQMGFNTDLLHAGLTKNETGSTLPPIYQSSAFGQESAEDLEKLFENKKPGYTYTRVANYRGCGGHYRGL